jgi:hypothetical protein
MSFPTQERREELSARDQLPYLVGIENTSEGLGAANGLNFILSNGERSKLRGEIWTYEDSEDYDSELDDGIFVGIEDDIRYSHMIP